MMNLTGFLRNATLLTLCFCGAACGDEPAGATRLSVESPESVGMDGQRLHRIERVVQYGLRRERMPGCVVCIGLNDRIVYRRAFGNRSLKPTVEPMTEDTVFDMASLTKPVATATCIHVLIRQGKLTVGTRAADILPGFGTNGKDEITVHHLLTHTSGLLPDNSLSDYEGDRKSAFRRIDELSLRAPVGEKFMYSDVGFIVLGRIVEAISGVTLDEFAAAHLFQPLKMSDTGFSPDRRLRDRCAPTEQRDDSWIRGEVHDPRSFALGGVAGHAGLFSTADDLSLYAAAILRSLNSAGTGPAAAAPILDSEAAHLMTAPVAVPGGFRTLGWDSDSPYSLNRGDLLSREAFGHGGFTGTAMWIDPASGLFVIFLSNRVHPDGSGSVNDLAGRIATIAAAALPTAADGP